MADERIVLDAIEESGALIGSLRDEPTVRAIMQAAELMSGSLDAGGKLLVFGNGGSAADATHLAAEFLGRFLRERAALPALALSDNASAVTAIANDYGFETVFARQIAGLGRPGDTGVAISTSGSSPNVVLGVGAARERGLRTVAITGAGGGELAGKVDVLIAVPSTSTPRIQEAHTLIAHALCDLVERHLS